MTAPYWLNSAFPDDFPDVSLALRGPDGLLAIGGDLSVARLLQAYQRGIFPWYNEDQPILWWSPDPRSVLFPQNLKVSRSLGKVIKSARFSVSLDSAFADVIACCAAPREDGLGTWISDEMQQAYIRLHEAGYAHSVECWFDDELVGGLYGVAIGRVFFGESMFSRMSNGSKVAFVYLARQLQQWNFALIDCQIQSSHLDSLGAQNMPRKEFGSYLQKYCANEQLSGRWQFDEEVRKSIRDNGGSCPGAETL